MRLSGAITILAFAFPIAALADLSETTILQTNAALNLDTGAIVSSGGDILWNGTTAAPQGGAKARSLGKLGITNFGNWTQALVVTDAKTGTSTPLAASVLVPGEVFVVLTNQGNAAKVLVIANSGGSLSIKFTTFGVSGAAGVPAVAEILNNSSNSPFGASNYGIAPSSLFVVTGSNLADPGVPVLQSSADPGLPLTLNGASLTVVVNNVTTHPALYYTSPGQLAAVLPAATPVGTGTLTVTYKGNTSAPAPILVVPTALGINFYYTNTGVATDAVTGAVLTYTSAGTPGESMVLWTTGLGADPGDSDAVYTLTPHRVNTPLQIYIGGILAAVSYQGGSGYPGVNVINLTIPDSVPTGCWVPLAAVAGGVISNIVTLPINKGGGACVDTQTGLTGGQIAPSGGQTLRTGLVALIQTDSTSAKGVHTVTNSTDAAFVKYTGLYTPSNSLSPGGCIIGPPAPIPVPAVTGLDPGAITLTGPNGVQTPLALTGLIKGTFYSLLDANTFPQSGGTFTFKGAGGSDVGSFTSTITLDPLLVWTNPSDGATIDRTKDLTVAWTGGNKGSFVYIGGTDTSATLGNLGTFTCLAKAEDGKFTVPSYILSALPAGSGGMQVQNDLYQTLTATGIDIGQSLATIYHQVPSTFE